MVEIFTMALKKKLLSKREKKLTYYKFQKKGRNNQGLITSQHRGGGHKRLYRKIDFKHKFIGITGIVKSIQYDPNRNADIALLHYQNGHKKYILHPCGLNIGDKVIANLKATISVGNSLPLKNIPLGTEIYNIELTPGKGGQLVRSAGTKAQILAKEGNFVSVRLPSKEIRLISHNCWATLGQVGNIDMMNVNRLKAGRSRWLNRKPCVRGAAKNPVDHPHGGGEGRAPIGRIHPMTPWGKPTLGKKTRKAKKYSDQLILSKRK